MSKVILVVGEQGVGKTTYIENCIDRSKGDVHIAVTKEADIKKALKRKSTGTTYLESNSIDSTRLSYNTFEQIEIVYCSIQRVYQTQDSPDLFPILEPDNLPF